MRQDRVPLTFADLKNFLAVFRRNLRMIKRLMFSGRRLLMKVIQAEIMQKPGTRGNTGVCAKHLCRDEGYNFDGERKQLAEGDTASIRSASDLLIALLDSLVETNICNFIEARSQTENLSLHVDNASGKISEQTILDTRRQINHLVNQFEDFFYGLADLHALTPHAMLSDAVREKLRDIRDAQNHLAKNALRLVTRLSELLQHCQFVLQQQTDQRLRQLTVLSAIFMPLTLITGVYGMNFAYMPETGWRYGYYATLAGMVWLAIFLWITLKRKGWFR